MEESEGLEGQIDDPRARWQQEMCGFGQYYVNLKHAQHAAWGTDASWRTTTWLTWKSLTFINLKHFIVIWKIAGKRSVLLLIFRATFPTSHTWENVLNVTACGKWNIWVQSTMPHRVFPPANTFTPETFTFYTFMVSGPKLWLAAYWTIACTVGSISLRPQWKYLTLPRKPGHIVDDNNINNDTFCFRSFLPSGCSKIKVCYPAMLLTCISGLGYCQLPFEN